MYPSRASHSRRAPCAPRSHSSVSPVSTSSVWYVEPLAASYSPLPTRRFLLAASYSPLPTRHSPLTTPAAYFSRLQLLVLTPPTTLLLTLGCVQLTAGRSRLTAKRSPCRVSLSAPVRCARLQSTLRKRRQASRPSSPQASPRRHSGRVGRASFSSPAQRRVMRSGPTTRSSRAPTGFARCWAGRPSRTYLPRAKRTTSSCTRATRRTRSCRWRTSRSSSTGGCFPGPPPVGLSPPLRTGRMCSSTTSWQRCAPLGLLLPTPRREEVTPLLRTRCAGGQGHGTNEAHPVRPLPVEWHLSPPGHRWALCELRWRLYRPRRKGAQRAKSTGPESTAARTGHTIRAGWMSSWYV